MLYCPICSTFDGERNNYSRTIALNQICSGYLGHEFTLTLGKFYESMNLKERLTFTKNLLYARPLTYRIDYIY